MPKHLDPADLPDDIARAAQAQVAAGRFASVEDVLRAGIAAVEHREQNETEYQTKLDALRAEIEKGKRSGIAEGYSIERVLARNDLGSSRG